MYVIKKFDEFIKDNFSVYGVTEFLGIEDEDY